jgi:hypothetical protein
MTTSRTALGLLALLAVAFGLAGPAQAQIVAFGASNVAGRGVSGSEAFPAQLERMLSAKGYNVHVANAGISGDTNAGMLARLDQAVPDGTRIVLLGAIGGTFNARRLGQGDQKAEFASIVARPRHQNHHGHRKRHRPKISSGRRDSSNGRGTRAVGGPTASVGRSGAWALAPGSIEMRQALIDRRKRVRRRFTDIRRNHTSLDSPGMSR